MWVERLETVGFKRLVGTFDFAPGLTLVVGPNEAGKSSLGEAFIRSVWGFEWAERRRREGGSPWERCRPWDGHAWRVVATLVDHDGRRLRAEWDFAQHTVRLLDALTGEDLSAHVAAKRGDVSLGSFLTGVTLGDFRGVCVFDQHTLVEVQRSDSLINVLQRAVETAQADVGVAEADGRLREFLNTHVGARADTYSLLAAGPLKRELDERTVLKGRIEAAQHAEAELADLAQQLHRRELQRTVLVEERQEIERGIRVRELGVARGMLDEALRQQELATAAPGAVGELDERLVSQAHESFGALDQADRALAELRRAVADAQPEVAEVRSAEHALLHEIEALHGVADLDRSAEAAVRDGLLAVRQIDEQPIQSPPSVPDRDPVLVRYRNLHDELLKLAGRPDIRWSWSRVVAALVVAAVSVALGVATTPLAFAGLALAVMLAVTARSIASSAELTDRLRSEFGVERLDDLERRAREEDELIAAARASVEGAQAAEAALKSRRDQAVTRLSRALDAASAAESPPLERAERYLEQCRQHDDLQQHTARLNEVRRRLAELSEPEHELSARSAEREALCSELRATLSQLGIECTDLAAARAELALRVGQSKERSLQATEAAAAQQSLDALLSGRTLQDLEQAAQEAERRLQEHKQQHPTVEAARGDLPSLRARLADAEAGLAQASELAASLQARISERESGLRSLPELRERLAALEELVGQRQLALEAIRTAREAVQEAARQAHRNFAPHLQRALQRTLPLFTAGRYRDVTIADDLSLSVVAPETGHQVPADCLSFGTRDQIYLVQRLEIAKLLLPATGPVPLVLDEPFAEFDEDRERSAVRLICQEAEERQVIVLSTDRKLVDLVTEVRGAPHLIELPGPHTTTLAA